MLLTEAIHRTINIPFGFQGLPTSRSVGACKQTQHFRLRLSTETDGWHTPELRYCYNCSHLFTISG